MSTILVVEDEFALRETLSYSLKKEGYTVQSVDTVRKLKPDLILLDIMLPEMDGFAVCRILRKEMHISILMLTARDEITDRVVSLEVGADDYLTKPFSMRELLARVKARFRRECLMQEEVEDASDLQSQNQRLVFDDLVITLAKFHHWDLPRLDPAVNRLRAHFSPLGYLLNHE